MNKNTKTTQQLLLEIEELRARLDVAQQRLQEAKERMQAEITERKRVEEDLVRAHKHAESIVETIREPLLVLAADLKVISANQCFYQTFKVIPEETEGRFIYSVGNHQWDIPALRKLLEEIVPQNSRFTGFEVDHEFPVIGRKMMLLNARRIYRQGKGTEMILLAIEDITERHQAREILEVSETRYRRLFETAQDGILIIDADTGQISDVNPFLIQMLGYSHEDFLGRKLWEIGAFKDIEASQRAFSELQTRGYVRYEDLPLQTRDGRSMAVEFVSNVYLVDHHKVIQCNIRDITQRKRAEEALRESEERFRVIASSTPDHLLVQDRELRYSFVINPLLDLTEKEMIGKTDHDFLSKEDADKLTKIKKQVIETGKPVHLEAPLISMKGKEHVFDGSYVPKFNAAGEINGLIGYFRNVTERKKAEEMLRRYELLSGQSRDIILFMRCDNGRILEANAAATNAYGYSRDELLTLSIQDLRASETQALTADQMVEADARGILFETIHRRKDGSTFPVEVSSRGATTGATRALISVIRDITRRKRAEQALRQSEKRYRSYIEVTKQLGWTTNADGEVLEDIPSWRNFTGQSEEEVRGWGWSMALHPDDLEHTAGVWKNAVTSRKNYEVEYRLRRYDGVYRHFLARGVPVFKDDGNIQDWVGTCIDITERKKAEEALKQHSLELRQMNETLEQRVRERTAQLEKANEELRHLSSKLLSAQEEERKRVAGEIHDTIGACLSAVMFKVQDVLQQTEQGTHAVTEPLRTIIPVVQESIDECRRIQMDLRPSMLDDIGILATLSWFCRRYQTIYPGIRIEQEMDIQEEEMPKPLKIVIYRVIQEAMNNIAKHSKADRARLSLRKLDDKLELVLRDNGRGFDQEKAHSQMSTRRGLGLSSMRERIELSGGSFSIESTGGKGTIVNASWPLRGTG
jgi:PAS domain S-box-containing protein